MTYKPKRRIGEVIIDQDVDFNLYQLLNARVEQVSSLPAAGNKGRIVFNLADNKIYYDNGTEWITFG